MRRVCKQKGALGMQPWTYLSDLGQVLGPREQSSCITRGTELEGRLPLQPLPGLEAGIHVSTFSFLSMVTPVGASTLMATWQSWGRVGTKAAPLKSHQRSDSSRAVACVSQCPLLPAHWEENPYEVLTSRRAVDDFWPRKEVRLLSLTGDLPWSHSLYPDALTWVGLEGGGAKEPMKWFFSSKGRVVEKAGKIRALVLALPLPPWALGRNLSASPSLSLLIHEMRGWRWFPLPFPFQYLCSLGPCQAFLTSGSLEKGNEDRGGWEGRDTIRRRAEAGVEGKKEGCAGLVYACSEVGS